MGDVPDGPAPRGETGWSHGRRDDDAPTGERRPARIDEAALFQTAFVIGIKRGELGVDRAVATRRLGVVGGDLEHRRAEADQLRRAMAAWRRTGKIGIFREKFISGMMNNPRGYAREFAERCFSQIEGFAEYGFPESHAAGFAQLAYASSWIKCHEPAAFLAAMLDSQPMGFYAPAQLVRDAREHGVEVRGVDVLVSESDCTLEEAGADAAPSPAAGDGSPFVRGIDPRPQPAVRLGLARVSGLSAAGIERLLAARRRREAERGIDRRQSLARGDGSIATLNAVHSGLAMTTIAITTVTPRIWLNVLRWASMPGIALIASSIVSAYARPSAAASAAAIASAAPSGPLIASACTVPSASTASGRFADSTSRHVSRSVHSPPWPLYAVSLTHPITVIGVRAGPINSS